MKDYLHRITRQWILITAITLMFFVGGIAYSSIPEAVPTQVYTASSQVLLIDSQLSANSGGKSRIATLTAMDLLASDFVREKVANQSGLSLQEFTDNVELIGTANPDSSVLIMIANSQDSELPVVVANAAADVIAEESLQLLNADSQIVETAQKATETVDLSRNTGIAKVAIPTVIGLLIGLFVAFVRAWSNNTLYYAQELLGLGRSQVVSVRSRRTRGQNSSVIDQDDLRKVRSLLPQEYGSVLLINETTEQDYSDFVSNLTATVGSLNERILVIDADLKSPSSGDLFSATNSSQGIRPGVSSSPGFVKLIHRVDEFTDVIPSAGLSSHPEDILGGKTFHKFINSIQNKYDQIVFLSPSVSKGSIPSTLAGLVESVVVVAETGVSNLGNVFKTVSILDQSPVSSIAVVVLDSKVVDSKETSGR